MYKVIRLFADLEDGGHIYQIGDIFPREGLEVSAERYKELESGLNKHGKPLIEKVDEPKKTPAKKKAAKK